MTDLVLHQLEKELREQVGFRGHVVLGGSHAYGEACIYSDTDYYLIARNVFELWKLLRKKKIIQKIKQDIGITDPLLLTSRELLKMKLFYLYGHDHHDNVVEVAYDPNFIAVTGVKNALRYYGDAMQSSDVSRQKYLIAKSYQQIMYAMMSVERKDMQLKRLFFTWLLETSVQNEHAKKIVGWKRDPMSDDVITDDDWKYVLDMIDLMIFNGELNKLGSWRSNCWHILFGLKDVKWFTFHRFIRRRFSPNYDKTLIRTMRSMIHDKDFEIWDFVSQECMRVLYV